ncbi:MAG: hypothetical protein RBS96_06105 [Dehalococcoidales bacterium]|jgi:hypothetical protein|nr:hypothetical protein [Dehalococcoidales bacterium]
MAFDAYGILKGYYGGVLVDIDENDVAATSKTANSDGNAVVEINGTPETGLVAAVILTEEADSDAYSDETIVSIQASDELDRNWETVAQSKVLRSHLILLKDCTASTAFVAADVTTPRVLTATTNGATGKIVSVDQALFTVGGVGDIVVEMQDDGDTYATPGDTLTATSGTGVATQGAAGVKAPEIQDQPKVHFIRFKTDKRYVRCSVSAEDNIGKGWILLTNISAV